VTSVKTSNNCTQTQSSPHSVTDISRKPIVNHVITPTDRLACLTVSFQAIDLVRGLSQRTVDKLGWMDGCRLRPS